MCGRVNVIDDPFMQALGKTLGLDFSVSNLQYSPFFRATQTLSIVREVAGQRDVIDATWWLLLDPTEDGFKPSKYTSFNTRYDKLNVPRSAGFKPFRQSRCIIPVSGFGETEFGVVNGKKQALHYHNMTPIHGAVAMAGLYKEWIHPHTGEITYSCSIVTNPPHEKLQEIHSKSCPLMLPQDSSLDKWLDCENTDPDSLSYLFQPHIYQDLNVQPIDKPGTRNPVGSSFVIHADEVA